jgi:hypothetical protein
VFSARVTAAHRIVPHLVAELFLLYSWGFRDSEPRHSLVFCLPERKEPTMIITAHHPVLQNTGWRCQNRMQPVFHPFEIQRFQPVPKIKIAHLPT